MAAYLKARKAKRYRGEILQFSFNLEQEILKLSRELESFSYRHGQYRHFIVEDAKRREISAAPFRDRVVHHAIHSVIEPIFDRGFISDSYAVRSGKGTHRAVDRLQQFWRQIYARGELVGGHQLYVLSCDISKYFASIDHQILIDLIRRKISDQNLLWLSENIINSTYGKSPGTGIPIGNLTSQLFANIYLDQLDQFIKHELGWRHYLRYMDDFLLLGTNKAKLWVIRELIREFLCNNLSIELNPNKSGVLATSIGIDWLGYRVYPNHKLLRGSSVRRFSNRTRAYQKRVVGGEISTVDLELSLRSWLAYAREANSHGLLTRLEEDLGVNLRSLDN